MDINFREKVTQAVGRINKYVRHTPLEYSGILSELTGAEVFLKTENYQLTGSFKIRGAFNKIIQIKNENKGADMVIAASTGNHAEAVALATERLNMKAKIYMPENVNQDKLGKVRSYHSSKVELIGDDCIISEDEAGKYATSNSLPYVSPYNDLDIVYGQGTIGYEILQDLPDVDSVLVPVGGGGLISGIAGYVKSMNKGIDIIGCQPENSKVMYESLKADIILDIPSLPTISDGTAGGIEPDAITFDITKEFVNKFIIVNEAEILDALKLILSHHHMIVEGAAGLSIASLIKRKEELKGKKVVCILCGNKASHNLLNKIVCENE